MDTKFINLKFESKNKSLKIGKNEPYRLLRIEGIDSGEFELDISNNALYDGVSITNRKIKYRSIVIECEYRGENLESERRKLAGFFNVHNDGSLIINYMGTQRKINYVTENFNAKLENVYMPLKFLVQLYCPDPFLTDVEEQREELAFWQGDFYFPLVIPQSTGITMGHRAPSLIVNILNKGDVPTGMKIVFEAKGTLKNPSLFNVNTREFIRINKEMVPGEKIIINTNRGNKGIVSISNGVTTNILNYIDIIGGGNTFLQLDVGSNLFRYDADEGLDNLEVNIYHHNKYLGV